MQNANLLQLLLFFSFTPTHQLKWKTPKIHGKIKAVMKFNVLIDLTFILKMKNTKYLTRLCFTSMVFALQNSILVLLLHVIYVKKSFFFRKHGVSLPRRSRKMKGLFYNQVSMTDYVFLHQFPS